MQDAADVVAATSSRCQLKTGEVIASPVFLFPF